MNHFIIRRNGIIEDGSNRRSGAHCRGKNHNSITMVGGVTQDDHTKAEDNYTMGKFKNYVIHMKHILMQK